MCVWISFGSKLNEFPYEVVTFMILYNIFEDVNEDLEIFF